MRRIAAIVLPDLACELARRLELVAAKHPFAVILDAAESDPIIDQRALLHAVDARAWRYGVRPGQSAAEASAYVAGLRIVRLDRAQVLDALGRVAEVALGFGTTASIALEDHAEIEEPARYPMGGGAGPFDTVWLDVSGCAHLVGGEEILCGEIAERVRELGHRARVSIAGGPRIAQAMARWKPAASPRDLLVPSPASEAAEHLGELPIAALPLDRDSLSWLGKLGILRIADLARLDRARLSHRLARSTGKKRAAQAVSEVLAFIQGRDETPLRPHQPARSIVERAELDPALDGVEPLMFVLGGFAARAALRLSARGEACSRVKLALSYDRGVVALENRELSFWGSVEPTPCFRGSVEPTPCLRGSVEPTPCGSKLAAGIELEIEPPLPLSREDELARALRAKLERLSLPAPITAVELILEDLGARPHTQLGIASGSRRAVDPHALPILLAELSAWIGPERVGVLRALDSHRPEARSRLGPADPRERARPPLDELALPEPTRLLPEPVVIADGVQGALVAIGDARLFVIDRLRMSTRIDRVEWWTDSPVSRDYARAWLRSSTGAESEIAEAWLFFDRLRGGAFLHGWFD